MGGRFRMGEVPCRELEPLASIRGQGTAKPKASGDDLLYRGTPLVLSQQLDLNPKGFGAASLSSATDPLS